MFLLIVLILGFLLVAFWKVIEKYDLETLGGCMLSASMVIACVSATTYVVSLGTLANMDAFYKRNNAVYTQGVKEFPNSGRAITKDDSTTVFTLPYDRVKLVANYNNDLTWYRCYQDHWFLGGFVGRASDDLNYITPLQ